MENFTNTTTAWTPSFVMSSYGHDCARVRTLGAIAVQDAAAVGIKGDFWGLPPGGQPTS